MRVNVQLIDAETGNHLWAERFDKPLADLFDMQDEIVARLAGSLKRPARRRRGATSGKSADPDSMDLDFQAMACLNKGLTPDNVAQAEAFSIARSPPIPTMSTRSRIGGGGRCRGASAFVADPIAAFAAAERG